MKIMNKQIAVSTRDLGRLLESIAKLSIKGNANEDALIGFLECFEPVFREVLSCKKFLRFNDGKDEIFYICQTQLDCDDYYFRAIHDNYDICDNPGFIVKQISFGQFTKLTKGKYMDFSLYSICDDGNLAFECENQGAE